MTSQKSLLLLVLLPFVLFLAVPARVAKAQGEGNDRSTTERQASIPDDQEGAANQITLPAGTKISIRIADEVNSSHNHSGDLITGTVDPSVFIDDHVVISRGTEAHVRVVRDRKGGRLHGKAAVSLELVGLVINSEKLDVDSDGYSKKQSALSAKLKGAGTAGAAGGTSAATSPNPAGGAVGPIIAVFRAAKVQLHAGTRIPFTLETPFTFEASTEQPQHDEAIERPEQR